MKLDLATFAGLICGLLVVAGGIAWSGGVSPFLDATAGTIVVGGALAATLVRFDFRTVLLSLGTGFQNAFVERPVDLRGLADEMSDVAAQFRAKGPLGLDGRSVSHPLLERGVRLIADGYDSSLIQESLERERKLYIDRLEESPRVFKSIGDAATAFGMIGTLIGLVQMLAFLDDPKKIGPSMSVAILTTLYGSLIQSCICTPLAEKCRLRLENEQVSQAMIVDGLRLILANHSPMVVKNFVQSYLPHGHRLGNVSSAPLTA